MLAWMLMLGGLMSAANAWSEPQSPFRRAIEVALDAKQIDGDETVQAIFFAPGMSKKDASDIRVAAEDGKIVPMQLIRGGSDDRVVLVFNPVKGKSQYYVYWGNPADQKPAPVAAITSGLLVEMKRAAAGQMDNIKQLQTLYERSGDVLARGLIDQPFVGYSPGGVDGPSISKITATLFAPLDGEYQIALSADDRGGLKLDGKDVVFAPGFPDDIRFNSKMDLKRGTHAFEYYHFDGGGDWRWTLGWRRPDTPKVDPIGADPFGRIARSKAGPLEQQKKDVAADMNVAWLGEAITAERSSYRMRFEAVFPSKSTNLRATWDFGDGQTATGLKVDHVYLSPGHYDVTIETKCTQGNDKRTFKLAVDRDPQHPIEPAMDDASQQSDTVAKYDYEKLNSAQQAMAARILSRGKAIDSLMPALSALCATNRHADQQWTTDALAEAIDAALDAKRPDDLAKSLASLTPKSNLQPKAADMHAGVLLWRLADFKQAETMLAAFKDRDSVNLKRLRMSALLLDGRVDEAKKLLEQLPVREELGKRAAISGALARSIEFYIDNNELDSAEESWDDWQRRYPESLWEGYSVLLKVRMMERRYPRSAAKIAEAFVQAAPASPYAPQLLDRASRILAKSDKTKSEALRKLLKEKYPEDPLSQ